MSYTEILLVTVLLVILLWWLLQRFTMHFGQKIWQVTASLVQSIYKALVQNPYISRCKLRHPRCSHFFAKRLDHSRFSGLPLTLLVVAFIYVFNLLTGVVKAVVTPDSIVSLDYAVAQLAATFQTPKIIRPTVWITSLGEPIIILLLFFVACALLWLMNRAFAVVGLLIATSGAPLVTTLGKLTFQRARPAEAVILESSYSFPSGHATISVAFYGFLGYLLIRSTQQWNMRVKLFFTTIGIVFLIGLSRIILGVHYLSDVWVGYLVGVMWLIIGVSVDEWLAANGRITWNILNTQHQKMMALIILAATGIGVIGYMFMREFTLRDSPQASIIQVERPLSKEIKDDIP